MTEFQYLRAESLDHLVELVAADPEGTRILAGGTDLLVFMADSKLSPRVLVDAKRIPGLDGIAADAGLQLGPWTRMRDLERHPAVRRDYTALAEGASEVGGVAIRHRATVGGNLGTASPAADTPPALLAFGAVVEVVGPGGPRELPLAEFYAGPGRHVLGPGEIIAGVRLPARADRSGSRYLKLATRRAMDIAFVGVAAAVELGDDGTVVSAGIGLAAVAPTPLAATQAAASLVGRIPDEAALAEAAELAQAASSPITDKRCSAEYRRAMVGELTKRALRGAVERAEG